MTVYKKKDSLCCIMGKKELCRSGAADVSFKAGDSSSAAKYTCLYLLDKSNKCAFIYGCGEEFPKDFKEQITKSGVHVDSHKKAFDNHKISYEWFLDENGQKPGLYKTLLVPFTKEDGAVDKVLGIVRKVDADNFLDKVSYSVAESEAPSLVSLLLNGREEEKRKIASLLHDEIGTAAVAINSLLAILKEDIKDGNAAQALADADKLQRAVAGSMDRMKKAVVNLRPPQIDDVGLDAAVRHFVDTLSASVPLKIDYKYKIKDGVQISDGVKIIIFRTVQEALNNVIKHADAKTAKIRIAKEADNIVLTVEDDGIGYKEEKSRTANKLGILGMKENVSYIGGTISIEGKPGKGTKIKVVCPIISYKRVV